jgi:glucuronosyltransferase
MDAAGQGGVVLISFGSTIDFEKVPQIYHEVFFKVIESNKDVRFLLRWKGPLPEEFKGRLNNLLTSEWLPQKELLRTYSLVNDAYYNFRISVLTKPLFSSGHPKMKVFITHGGLNSVQEATSHGIPLIVLPLFAGK